MDFNQLLSRMQELDSPALEADTTECGMNMPAPPAKPDTPEPSMTVNVNAQGMDNIESMLSLMAKISGAGKADMPSMAPMPAIMPLDKMMGPAPDMDADNDDKVGGEMDLPKDHDNDHVIIKTLDKDGDNDHDMDDHEKEEAPTGTGMAASMKGVDEKDPDAADKMKPGVANAPDADDDGKLGMGKNVDPKQIKLDDIDMEELLKLAGQETEGAMDDAAKDFSAYHQAQAASTEKTMAAIRDAIKAALTSDPKDQNNDDDGEKNADEAYANEPSEKMRGTDYMNNKIAGGMNRPKGTYPKVAAADNPMQKVKEGDDLRTRIHNELAAKLAEIKGAE